MSEEIVSCWNCGFKMVKSQLYKSEGSCPRCKKLMDKAMKDNIKAAKEAQ